MKKILASRFAAFVAIAIFVCVTAYLVLWCKIGDAIIIFAVLLIMGIIGDMRKVHIIHYAPLVAYIIMVVFAAIEFALEEECLRSEEGTKLVKVVIYGSIYLLTTPILYYNRSLK